MEVCLSWVELAQLLQLLQVEPDEEKTERKKEFYRNRDRKQEGKGDKEQYVFWFILTHPLPENFVILSVTKMKSYHLNTSLAIQEVLSQTLPGCQLLNVWQQGVCEGAVGCVEVLEQGIYRLA